ncbi:hypothetical protein [Streptomyces mayteni]
MDEHIRAEFNELTAPAALECADVLYIPGARSVVDALSMVDLVLNRYPGCLVVVAREGDEGCVAGMRDGCRIRMVRAGDRASSFGTRECAAVASLLHGHLVLGAPWRTLRSIELREVSRPPLRLWVVTLN